MNGCGLMLATGEVKEPMMKAGVKPSYIGSFIYSYARRLMYNNILSRVPTYYMDTDSALMNGNSWDKLTDIMGSGLGELSDDMSKNSAPIDRAHIVMPKTYGLYAADGTTLKVRAKGIRHSRDKWIGGTDVTVDNVDESELIDVGDESFYKNLIAGKQCNVLSWTMKRGVTKTGVSNLATGKSYLEFSMRQPMVIKTIRPPGWELSNEE